MCSANDTFVFNDLKLMICFVYFLINLSLPLTK